MTIHCSTGKHGEQTKRSSYIRTIIFIGLNIIKIQSSLLLSSLQNKALTIMLRNSQTCPHAQRTM